MSLDDGIDDLTGFEEELQGSEFDLRETERQMFAQLYTKFLKSYFDSQMNYGDSEVALVYLNISKTLISTVKRYARHKEEMYSKASELENSIQAKIDTLNNSQGQVIISTEFKDKVKEFIEDLRHEANLKIPQKKKANEDEAWKKSV